MPIRRFIVTTPATFQPTYHANTIRHATPPRRFDASQPRHADDIAAAVLITATPRRFITVFHFFTPLAIDVTQMLPQR
jgi:hypothetical protein